MQTLNCNEANLYGHVRLFAMENDFSSFSVNNIEYPYTSLFDPFTFDHRVLKVIILNLDLKRTISEYLFRENLSMIGRLD